MLILYTIYVNIGTKMQRKILNEESLVLSKLDILIKKHSLSDFSTGRKRTCKINENHDDSKNGHH